MEEEEGNEIQRAENKREIKITLTPQHTHTHTHNHRREEEKIDCTDHLKHNFELLTTNNMKLIEQIHNTWVPNETGFLHVIAQKTGG